MKKNNFLLSYLVTKYYNSDVKIYLRFCDKR